MTASVRGLGNLGVVALLVALLGSAGPSATAQAAECAMPNQVVTEGDGWTWIAKPRFSVAPQELRAYAVDPIDPDRMFVSNGRAVMRSVDGGCTWEQVHTVNTTVPTGVDATVEQIVIPASPAAHDRVYLVIAESAGGRSDELVIPHVVRSDNGGSTWTRSDAGLLPHGAPVELAVVDGVPDTLYLATTILTTNLSDVASSGTATIVYVSRDGGATWLPTTSPIALVEQEGEQTVPPPFADLAVDPIDPQQVWGAAVDGLWWSRDGGTRWKWINFGSGFSAVPLEVVDVFHEEGSPPRIWAFSRDERSFRSDDGGSTWVAAPGVRGVDSVVHGTTVDDVLAAQLDQDTSWVRGFRSGPPAWWDTVKGETVPAISDLSADQASPRAFYGRASDRIWRSPRTAGPVQPPPGGVIGRQPPGGPPPPMPLSCTAEAIDKPAERPEHRPPSLSPQTTRIELRPGESEQVRHSLELPATVSAPADLYFLVDASPSMEPALCGAARYASEIGNRLLDSGIDAWFGVGTYQELVWQEYPSIRCYAYRRDRDIAPLNDSFRSALLRIRTCGQQEPQMTALVQTAAGSGLPPYIPPDQNANFRTGAVPVVIHISDEMLTPFQPNTPADAIAALRAKGIFQVGIDPMTGATPLGSSTEWLEMVARGTDAVAKPPGVDCDGDGEIDISPGEPLVCQLPVSDTNRVTLGLADAVVDMVSALVDDDDGAVRLVENTNSGVVGRIEPDVYPAVNLRTNNSLSFDVTYTCLPEQVGKTFSVELAGQVREKTVATATAEIVCSDMAEPGPEIDTLPVVPPPVVPPVAGIAPVPPPPPPPPPPPAPIIGPAPAPGPAPGPAQAPGPAPAQAPAPQAQPQPNPQSQPQGQMQMQAQAQPQAGLAVQEKTQPQTALAQADSAVKEQEGYSIAQQRRRYEVEPLHVLGAGSLLIMGLACVRLARNGAQLVAARTGRATRRL